MKKVLMFSGQGSQYPNMGIDVLTLPENKEKLEIAENIFGFNILEALKNENIELSQTKYTQPLLVLVSILLFDQFKKNHDFDAVIGFSLGEYSALYANGIYSYNDILNIVKYRSLLMEEAAISKPGKMVAVLNFEPNSLEKIVNQINDDNDIVTIANYNSRNQLVISGNTSGVDKVIEELKNQGVKRMVPLNVSGGFHSKLMFDASQKLYDYLIKVKKNNNKKTMYLNTTAKPLVLESLESELQKQMYSSVLFYQTIEELIKNGYTSFIEIGPGKVLKNLVFKNYSDVKVSNIENLEDLLSLGE